MKENPFDNYDLQELDALLGDLSHPDDDFDLAQLSALLGETEETVPPEDAVKAEPIRSQPEISAPAKSPKKTTKAKKEKKQPVSSEPKAFRPGRKNLLIATVSALMLVILCLLGILIPRALDPYAGLILSGTTVGGIDVGNMTQGEARRAIRAATKDTISSRNMEVMLPGGTISLSPRDTGIKVNVRSAVKAAYALGRKGTEAEIRAAAEAAQGMGTELPLLPHLKLEEGYIRSQLEAYAVEHNVPHRELSYRLEGQQPQLGEADFSDSAVAQTLQLTLGTPREELDVDAALEAIEEAYSRNQLQAVVSTDLLSQPQAPDLEAIAEEFYIAPVNTTLDLQTYQQVPGSYGYALDVDTGKQLLADAAYGQTIAIPMTFVEPEILGDGAYFREELGYCQTKHTDNKDRNTNLTLACAALDGLILQPGEEFSFNGTVGERTKDKGYKPAAAYSGLNTVNSIGGGVCQVSTTLYNAALLADMEIVFRINHGFRSSYIGVGLDATVNWGGPDFQFRNNSHFPIMIQAEVSEGYVKVKLLGTDEKDYYVKMTSGYSEDDKYVYSWSYKSKFDKETDELISKEKEAFSTYLK